MASTRNHSNHAAELVFSSTTLQSLAATAGYRTEGTASSLLTVEDGASDSSCTDSAASPTLHELVAENAALRREVQLQRQQLAYFRSINTQLMLACQDGSKAACSDVSSVVEVNSTFAVADDRRAHRPADGDEKTSRDEIADVKALLIKLETVPLAPFFGCSQLGLHQANLLDDAQPRVKLSKPKKADASGTLDSPFWQIPAGCKFTGQCYVTRDHVKPVFTGPRGGLFYWQNNQRKRYVKSEDPKLRAHHMADLERAMAADDK